MVEMIILLSNNIFDGISNESYKGAIVIEGDRIKEVIRGTFEYDQYDGQIIDLNDKFVMPGLIDCHVHLIMTEPKYGRYDSRSISEGVLRSIKYLEDAINNGITTLRDCGSEHDGIFALKDFSEKNMIGTDIITT
jgi:imidazolonepropionase-like amidohydrolase